MKASAEKTEFFTAAELVERGKGRIPELFRSGRRFVYSSPATLAYNSPGAEGFGVKRAGLALPGSVMLIVSPGCCGRNTSGISSMPAYRNRFFYLTMDETDIVTGRHTDRIAGAVSEVVDFLSEKPSVVMICVTCVDALLGTDLDAVCLKAEEVCGVRVRPCYMYALTREGSKPPMVHVRQSLYSLLSPLPKNPRAVNLLGFFSPLDDDCELYRYLEAVGIRKVREISRCASYEEFLQMGEANFNLILFPEVRAAAEDLEKNCGIPSIELSRFYDPDRVHRQYQAFSKVLGAPVDDAADRKGAQEAIDAVRALSPNAQDPLAFSVGESMDGDPFELAAALLEQGFAVREIFGPVFPASFPFLRRIAALSPRTRVYCNEDPSMLFYDPAGAPVNLTIGKDAGYYHPEAPNLPWNADRQPYGYQGIAALYASIQETLAKRGRTA